MKKPVSSEMARRLRSAAFVAARTETRCSGADTGSPHSFVAVDVTPRTNYNANSFSSGIPQTLTPPTFKLYCQKCGEVRPL